MRQSSAAAAPGESHTCRPEDAAAAAASSVLDHFDTVVLTCAQAGVSFATWSSIKGHVVRERGKHEVGDLLKQWLKKVGVLDDTPEHGEEERRAYAPSPRVTISPMLLPTSLCWRLPGDPSGASGCPKIARPSEKPTAKRSLWIFQPPAAQGWLDDHRSSHDCQSWRVADIMARVLNISK